MLRRTDLLIAQVLKQASNSENSPSATTNNEEVLQYLNDAQHRLQAAILRQHPNVFLSEKIISASYGVDIYDIPSNSFLGNRITNVEYSSSGNAQDYYSLTLSNLKNRYSGVISSPVDYIRRSGTIILSPAPQRNGSKIRLNYTRRINELDLVRGVISQVTLGTSNSITLLTIDTSANPPLDSESLSTKNYLCICDRAGNITMANIPYDSIDSTTGIVTITSGFQYEDGEYIDVGGFVVGGQDTSTHSEFDRSLERYLLSYATWKLMKKDSSTDSQEGAQELLSIEKDIVESYADITDDVITIPIINSWVD